MQLYLLIEVTSHEIPLKMLPTPTDDDNDDNGIVIPTVRHHVKLKFYTNLFQVISRFPRMKAGKSSGG